MLRKKDSTDDLQLSNTTTIEHTFNEEAKYKVRSFKGRLDKPKAEVDVVTIADRIISMEVDVLAVQEVENIGILQDFNRSFLGDLYLLHIYFTWDSPIIYCHASERNPDTQH